ncbi:MAG: site-specific DNA-methyltransferase [Alkaliphilus sp.]|nr:site-specific DNA-methyltransferase [Alkaliphilus sp.]
MQKLKMKSKNLTKENIEKIGELFPNVITEMEDEEGNTVRAIDFELLQQELSDEIVEGSKERYQLTWPGKREAIVAANTPIDKTLRPVKEGSLNWGTTGNLYMEGDNLEILKLLQESYLEKIKCIYIDPPYNTGNDFIYKDNFVQDRDEYLEESGQVDEEGNRLFLNTEYNGRYHSDWLTMMYPRLKLARNLLSVDGVIFISIDDNEVHNLKKVCDEVFGEKNFVTIIAINRTSEIATNNIISKHEYIIVFCKNTDEFRVEGIKKYTISRGTVGNANQTMPVIEFPKGLRCLDIHNGVYETTRKIEGSNENIENFTSIVVKDGRLYEPIKLKARWRSSNDMRNFFKNNCRPTPAKISGIIEEIYFKGDRFMPQIKKSTYEKIPSLYLENKRGSNDLNKLSMNNLIEYPKSVSLISKIISYINLRDNDIILDFFSGSATTAHAVMELNAEDGGNRKYIMVQLPELTDEKSEAYKAGYKNISEIGKERICRAGKKIKEETGADIDYGFRIYKVDSTNMKDVYYHPDELAQKMLEQLESNIKGDRTGIDLLTQIMLETGLELSLPMETEEIREKEVHFVAGNSLIACFDEDMDEELIKKIAEAKPLRAVFRDNSFKSCPDKINLEEIFKGISPNTDIRVL